MAESAGLRQTFDHYVIQGNPNATSMTNKNFAKLCKDCKVVDGKKVTNADVDIMFSKYKAKGQQTITFDQFMTIIDEMGKKRYGEAAKDIYGLLSGRSPLAVGATRTSKTGGVEKMTDTSLYTGTHTQRFGSDGKGLGMTGRQDTAENSGYVGNYKDAGTYDKKH